VPTSGSYTYKVTALYRSWSSTSASSGSVAVTIATATKLAFTTQPTNTTAGAAFAVAVTVQDAGGVAVQVPGRSVSVAIGTNPGSATLSGTLTATTDASGVATFNSLSINKVGTGYTLSAASSGLTAATSAAFNISVGSVTALAFTTQPSNATGGVAFTTQPVVKLQDASGNNVGAGTNQVTLSLTAPANGATLSCANNSVNAVAGTATFSGCKIDLAGTYSLTATSGTLAAAQSNSISVTVGPATSLVFSTQPSGSTGGTVFATQPTVKIVDAGGNTTTATSTITLALTNSSSGATLTCTGGLSKAAAGGVAAFAGCKIDKVGTYTLSASASSLNGATSNSVVITTGAAAALCFVGTSGTTCLSGVQTVGNKGTFSGRVQLVDLGGNPVAATTAVTVSLSSNGDLGVPSPGSVTIAAASSVSGALSDAIVNSGGNSTGVLTGSSSGLTSATVTIHA
jgi:trimeric autotransporter adhesin